MDVKIYRVYRYTLYKGKLVSLSVLFLLSCSTKGEAIIVSLLTFEEVRRVLKIVFRLFEIRTRLERRLLEVRPSSPRVSRLKRQLCRAIAARRPPAIKGVLFLLPPFGCEYAPFYCT